MIKLFSKWILLIYRKIWVYEAFLIKLYFKTTLPLFAAKIEVNADTFFLVYAVTLTVVRPFAGKVSDKYGEGIIIIPALFTLIAALLVLAMTNGIIGLVITAILYGIGFGSAQPALQVAMIRLASPEKRGIANATFLLLLI